RTTMITRPVAAAERTATPSAWRHLTRYPLLVHRCRRARQVQQVLHLPHALNLARLLDELVDQLGPLDLAAKLDDSVLHVDGDLALRCVGVTEDLRADLVRERRVVERFRLFRAVLDLLGDAVRLRGDPTTGPGAPPGA